MCFNKGFQCVATCEREIPILNGNRSRVTSELKHILSVKVFFHNKNQIQLDLRKINN